MLIKAALRAAPLRVSSLRCCRVATVDTVT